MLIPASFRCGACGEQVETSVDPAQARRSRYVEDCQVCCRPHVLTVSLDPGSGEAWVDAELEADEG